MPFNNGNDKTTKHPVIVHSRRSNRQPSVQLALKCPKGKPCRLNASDSDVSTDYGSITNLLGHDVSYKRNIQYSNFWLLLNMTVFQSNV